MKINRVTITGADNNTNIDDMFNISHLYPFVEWGILFSPKRIGEERYPDMNWVFGLLNAFCLNPYYLKLSAHLCGGYTREMLMGQDNLLKELSTKIYLGRFGRYQLNFNASKSDGDCDKFFPLLKKLGWDFIFQHNHSNKMICNEAIIRKQPISFLYDSSGGRVNAVK